MQAFFAQKNLVGYHVFMMDKIVKSLKSLVVDAITTPTQTYIPSAWRNLVTGLGGQTDPMSYHVPDAPTILDHTMLQNLYDGDNFAAKIVAANPQKAFKKGFFISYNGENERDKELVSEVSNFADKISLADRSYEAALLGRLHGGSALLMNTTNEDLETPFPESEEIFSLLVLDAREITPNIFYDPTTDQANERFPDHGSYESNIIVGSTYQTIQIHPSRMAVFGGNLTPRRDRWEKYSGWDASVLQNVYVTLRMLSSDLLSKSAMMKDSSLGILKIKRLWDLLAQNKQDLLQTRMEIGHYARSSMRLLPIDSEEDFNWVERSFAGMKDLIEIDMYIVSSAANMPVTVLFGRSPGGQNSTGEHDQENWNATIEASQVQSYTPPIESVVQKIAGFLGATDLDGWGIEWNSLEVLSSKEQADLEKVIAETDMLRNQIGIDEAEIIKWRHGQGEYRKSPPVFDPELIDEWIESKDRWIVPAPEEEQ
jgi:phage-related protein (TIGR01555 family)